VKQTGHSIDHVHGVDGIFHLTPDHVIESQRAFQPARINGVLAEVFVLLANHNVRDFDQAAFPGFPIDH
jgi:hypothetical protein